MTLRNSKGFIVTLDALLAVILVGLMASSALTLVSDSQNMDWKEIYLQRILDDVVATLDEAGLVTSGVDKTSVDNTLALLPSGICVQLEFTEKGSSSPYATVVRSGCGAPSGRISVARRQALYYGSGALDTWTVVLAKGWYQ